MTKQMTEECMLFATLFYGKGSTTAETPNKNSTQRKQCMQATQNQTPKTSKLVTCKVKHKNIKKCSNITPPKNGNNPLQNSRYCETYIFPEL